MRPFLTLGDSNEALPHSSGHQPVPGKVSAFFFLLTSIAMQTLRDLYQLIPRSEWISMRPFLTLADSQEALPDSSGHRPMPGEVSAFFFQLTSIAMRALRDLYHSIPLDWGIPTHPVPMLSDHWQNGYAYFCTFVLWVSTFKLLATECYRHADTSRPIPFNSPR